MFLDLAEMPVESSVGTGADVGIGRADRVDPRAEALLAAIAQQEHRHPLVMLAPLADLFPLIENRARDSMDRATNRGILEQVQRAVDRRIPRLAKTGRGGVAAQRIGGGARLADPLARFLDAAAIGQRLDERDLAGGGPAVVARAEQGGGEFFGFVSYKPICNIILACGTAIICAWRP